MFIRKYWLPVTVFIVALVGVGLYYQQTRPPKPPIVIVKPVEPVEKPTAKSPVGETSQGGHFHEDGTWHEGPQVEVSAEARMDQLSADMAPAKTAREQNAAHLRLLESFSPKFFRMNEPMYNFLKEHPDFSFGHSTPELEQKYIDALDAVIANGRAYDEKRQARHQQRLKNRDMRPIVVMPPGRQPNPGGNQ